MNISVIPTLTDNFSYLIETEAAVAVVDAGEAQPIIDAVTQRNRKPDLILCTHHHSDHVAGNLELKSTCGSEVVGPDDSRIPGLDRTVADGDTVNIGPLRLTVIATPGHGRNDVSYYLAADGGSGPVVWTGDTLFVGGCGRLFEGDPAEMWQSLSRLATLPDETLVYCGHEYTVANYNFAASLEPGNAAVQERRAEVKRIIADGGHTVPSTIAREKATNPFLRATTNEMRQQLGIPDASDVDTFAEIRGRKDRF